MHANGGLLCCRPLLEEVRVSNPHENRKTQTKGAFSLAPPAAELARALFVDGGDRSEKQNRQKSISCENAEPSYGITVYAMSKKHGRINIENNVTIPPIARKKISALWTMDTTIVYCFSIYCFSNRREGESIDVYCLRQ